MNDSRQNSRNGILSLTIKDKAVLYSAVYAVSQ
jgi:Tfp pilus assembly protein PilZ